MRKQNREGEEEVDESRVIVMRRNGSKYYKNLFVKFSKN